MMILILIILIIIPIIIIYFEKKRIYENNIIYFKNYFNNNLNEDNVELINNYLITKNFIKNNDNFLELILNNNYYEFLIIEYEFDDNIIERTKQRISEWNNENYVLKEKNFKIIFRIKDNNKKITIKDINIINKYLQVIIHDDDLFINKKFISKDINYKYKDFQPFENYDSHIIKFNIAESHYDKKIKISINNDYKLYCEIYNKYNQNIYNIDWSNVLIIEPNIRYILYLTNNNNMNNRVDNSIINSKYNVNLLLRNYRLLNDYEIINLLENNNFTLELI